MEKSHERRWFQIHLSSAIVLMLVIGAFMGVNFTPSVKKNPAFRQDSMMMDDSSNSEIEKYTNYGWPATSYSVFSYPTSEMQRLRNAPHSEIISRGISANILFCMIQLVLVLAVMEGIARQRYPELGRKFTNRIPIYSAVFLTLEAWFVLMVYLVHALSSGTIYVWPCEMTVDDVLTMRPHFFLSFAADIGTLIALLFVVAVACEFCMRRQRQANTNISLFQGSE